MSTAALELCLAMRRPRHKPEPPLAEELAPFVLAIPTRSSTERIVTRDEVLFGLRVAAQLTGPYYVAKKRTHQIAPPVFAIPLHMAYHAWPATQTHASLSFVLGEVATPFTLMLLIHGGNTHPSVLALFRDAMIPLLEAGGHETRTRGFRNLWEMCVQWVGQELGSDAVLARLVLRDASMRSKIGCSFLGDGLLPWDLPACMKQADFQAAVRALHAEHPVTVTALLQNARLRREELAQAFALVNTPDTDEWIRLEAVEHVLRNSSVTAPIVSTIAAEDWRHVAQTSPDVIGSLWSAFSTEERHWLSVFAALASTPFEFTEYLAHLAERLARWTLEARALAATLLTSSSVPATATAGSLLL
ncbi:MAG: hypothetical protein V4813_13075 [Gemmatimonadota bacterium]